MRAASTAALRALSTPTQATGTPGGICEIESSASRPPAIEVLEVSGTPITGRSVWAATTPGRAADRPALERARLKSPAFEGFHRLGVESRIERSRHVGVVAKPIGPYHTLNQHRAADLFFERIRGVLGLFLMDQDRRYHTVLADSEDGTDALTLSSESVVSAGSMLVSR